MSVPPFTGVPLIRYCLRRRGRGRGGFMKMIVLAAVLVVFTATADAQRSRYDSVTTMRIGNRVISVGDSPEQPPEKSHLAYQVALLTPRGRLRPFTP